jgi:CRP/FNR family cyclic AMP-dependent transcriptional regulator
VITVTAIIATMDALVAEKISNFFSRYTLRHYKKGQVLIHAGDQPQFVLHLVQGKVKQYDLSNRGEVLILNIFKPPAFLPLSNIINDTPNPYFFEADSEVELHQAPAAEVITFLKSNPDVTYDLLARVYRGTDGMLRRMAHLMVSSAKARLQHELVIESKRFGDAKAENIKLNISESDLAARAGLSRETVSREIQKLKAEGLIELRKKQVLIPSLDKLELSLRDSEM